ncbi:NF-kappa-B-activating protein [Chloropicon primus]|uniref:NF-kappa-B-activating protein n=1 Tax=Chloropicon primus TaxID=1764295 RepID=A0A5B8MXR8_9CHLO|nr:NF-kappa-B-activating protein [Chloropicon primus]UPR03540.1 NF-kappa-B-activating protein [Chloropicon primus]|eukprot:QDZ24332.1 NF-kappa-B-activating protein [Chloropicon primus]
MSRREGEYRSRCRGGERRERRGSPRYDDDGNGEGRGYRDGGRESRFYDGQEREQRRVKRLELTGKVRVDLWAASPSPPPEEDKGVPSEQADRERDEREAEEAKAREQEAAAELEKEKRKAAEEEEASDEEDARAELQRFKAFLESVEREREAKLAEQARIEEESKLVGPEKPEEVARAAPGTYGKHLLPGEGDAMAAYVQSGQRIPRRGEIGLTSDKISSYEDLGYIMSGNRHSRMNAIRIRKENQVYSAEEKAALAMINFEEKKVKEQQVMQNMQALVRQHLEKEGNE